MTERLHFHFSCSCIGEGNGNPLQCSCLENPRDGVARWAAIYGVAQSWTWLKRLSSSSSMYETGSNLIKKLCTDFPCSSDSKESACKAGDLNSVPGWERSPGVGICNPLQYSCLENSMDRGAWQATVHGVAWSQTWLSNSHTHTKLIF